jgi:dihydrofolate reductase
VAKLVYSSLASLDGYVSDESGDWSWARPDEQVHAAVNELERGVGTYLYGRRMYEVLVAWETADFEEPYLREYAEIWRDADKVVYSRTLEEVGSARTRIERDFDPGAVARLKAETDRDIGVGGPGLAGHALRAGLVDELHLFVAPAVVGGGTPSLPDRLRLDLDLLGQRRFDSGFAHLHYRVNT